jgi:hypothetical protein
MAERIHEWRRRALTRVRATLNDLGVVDQSCDLHRSGPWLVLHAHEPQCQTVVKTVAQQCTNAGVTTDIVTFMDVDMEDVFTYTGLVIVLPARLDETWWKLSTTVVAVAREYRSRRPSGLRSLRQGCTSWHKAGVMQMIGPRTMVRHPALAEATQRACFLHYLDEQVDVFSPFDTSIPIWEGPPAPAVDPSMDGDATATPLWRYLKTWNITSIRLIPPLRKCVEDCRDFYENPTYPALYRPVSGVDANRLTFILDGIEHEPSRAQEKTWNENGARAWRYVAQQLREIEPNFSRPDGRSNTKGAQKDLHNFYLALRSLHEFLKLVPEREWEHLFMDE